MKNSKLNFLAVVASAVVLSALMPSCKPGKVESAVSGDAASKV